MSDLEKTVSQHGIGNANQGADGRRPPERVGWFNARSTKLLASVALVFGFVLTTIVSWQLYSEQQRSAQLQFDAEIEAVRETISESLMSPLQGLNGARGVYVSSKSVERREFAALIDSLDADVQFPHVDLFGVLKRVNENDISSYVAAARQDDKPKYEAHPAESILQHWFVLFAGPEKQEAEALGFDFAANAVVLECIGRAIDLGEPQLASTSGLPWGERDRAVWVLPVYQNGTCTASVMTRREHVAYVLFASIDLAYVYHHARALHAGFVDFAIRPVESRLKSGNSSSIDSTTIASTRVFELGNQSWELVGRATPSFNATVASPIPLSIFILGNLLAMATAGVILALGSSRERAHKLAQEMTQDLRKSNVSLRKTMDLLEEQTSLAQELAREADEANRSKSDFLANMSHEIRTPMTAILGFTDLLWQDGDILKAPEKRINAIRTIQRNGEHLLGVINDILDISKIEAGKLSIEQTTCSPCEVLAEVASLMQVKADQRKLAFEIVPDGPLPKTIESDALRLRQILLNLVGNAIKFTENGSVTLVPRLTAENPSKMQFDVIDTGIGMTEEQAARLFRPFEQADSSMARRFGGTGLGLTISQRLASMLGGRIEIAATGPGEGTTVRVTVDPGQITDGLLIDDVRSAITERIELAASNCDDRENAEEKRLLKGIRVLLAEDGIDNQRLVSMLLERAGAEVGIADNGKAAVQSVWNAVESGAPFDLVLMDMQMPIMDGYEATGLLRAKGYQRPIVALTAHAMDGEREKCIASGCSGYLTKPINKRDLIRSVLKFARAGRSSAPATMT